jgi:hypothetical protein
MVEQELHRRLLALPLLTLEVAAVELMLEALLGQEVLAAVETLEQPALHQKHKQME